MKGCKPSLKYLTEKLLGKEIQSGEHNSIIDARATLMIYKTHEEEWEKHIREKIPFKKSKNVKKSIYKSQS